MKRISILFLALILSGCSVDDDNVNLVNQFAVVSQTDLPESFEKGKIYTVKVKYLLPTACHTAAGVDARRGDSQGNRRRDIFVTGVARSAANMGECTRVEENLEREGSFSILIDENEPYTFHLWRGVNAENQNQFTVVVVPVIQ